MKIKKLSIFIGLFLLGLFLLFLFPAANIQAYQPPGKESICPDLPQISIGAEPTSGTKATQYKITLKWEEMSQGNFDKYKDTEVDIYLFENSNPRARPLVFTGNNKDSSFGRTHNNADYIIKDLVLMDGNYNIPVKLSLNGTDICMGYQKNEVILQVTVRNPTSTPPTTPPSGTLPPGAAGKPCTPLGEAANTGIETAIGCAPTEPTKFILAVSRLATGMGGGIALLLIIAGAFKMIASAGNPDAVKAGSEQITSALIGLLFIIFAVLLLKIIGVDILALPGFEVK